MLQEEFPKIELHYLMNVVSKWNVWYFRRKQFQLNCLFDLLSFNGSTTVKFKLYEKDKIKLFNTESFIHTLVYKDFYVIRYYSSLNEKIFKNLHTSCFKLL